MKDLHNNVAVSQLLNPQTATTTKTSSALDLRGFNSAEVVFAIGASGDTLSGTVFWTLKLQHSDDDSTYADVATSDLLGGVSSISIVVDAPGEAQQSYKFGYVGSKRYLKAVATPTGTHTNGTPMAMLGLRGHAAYAPVN